ncbi:fumarylacetoacetate hydrolase family protein [Pelagibacterium sp.]|uniref:fumarylacetoacetate hydrolase family protein n=1 Tax=Pelagibacterium sp. TaxID=1967288 RepID=UPI003A8D7B03
MKLSTLQHQARARVGILIGDDYVLLDNSQFKDMVDFVTLSLEDIEALAAASVERVRASEAVLLAPIGRFGRDVLCTGWNYWDHFDEGVGKRDGQEVERPVAPTFFTKAPNAITGPFDDIPIDDTISKKWDYEGEIAVVIGRQGRSISPECAHEHIFGYMLANDVSQRDLQRRHGGQWLKGKSIDRSSPTGPYIVTADEITFDDIEIQTFVNDEQRQSASTRQMAFALPELIAELSFGMTLYPGDVILTGTPSGIGMAMTPPRFLAAGDHIRVVAKGLGELSNRCVATAR